MSTLGVDASFTHEDAAQLARDGVKAIGRYCPGGGADPGKTLTAGELQALLAHGIAVWLVFELTAGRWRGGYPAGLADGKAARAGARSVGWPDTRPIYTGFDENVGPGDHDNATGYQRGFDDGQAAAGARPGGAAYGDGYVLRILTEQLLLVWKWLSDSSAFTESAQYARSGQASIVQFYGRTLPGLSGIDVDDLLVADFGQHPAPNTPSPSTGGNTMARTVAHDELPSSSRITLNADGSALVAQSCHPWDVKQAKVDAVPGGQIFHFDAGEKCSEIVASFDGEHILCHIGDAWPDVDIVHGHVR